MKEGGRKCHPFFALRTHERHTWQRHNLDRLRLRLLLNEKEHTHYVERVWLCASFDDHFIIIYSHPFCYSDNTDMNASASFLFPFSSSSSSSSSALFFAMPVHHNWWMDGHLLFLLCFSSSSESRILEWIGYASKCIKLYQTVSNCILHTASCKHHAD